MTRLNVGWPSTTSHGGRTPSSEHSRPGHHPADLRPTLRCAWSGLTAHLRALCRVVVPARDVASRARRRIACRVDPETDVVARRLRQETVPGRRIVDQEIRIFDSG